MASKSVTAARQAAKTTETHEGAAARLHKLAKETTHPDDQMTILRGALKTMRDLKQSQDARARAPVDGDFDSSRPKGGVKKPKTSGTEKELTKFSPRDPKFKSDPDATKDMSPSELLSRIHKLKPKDTKAEQPSKPDLALAGDHLIGLKRHLKVGGLPDGAKEDLEAAVEKIRDHIDTHYSDDEGDEAVKSDHNVYNPKYNKPKRV